MVGCEEAVGDTPASGASVGCGEAAGRVVAVPGEAEGDARVSGVVVGWSDSSPDTAPAEHAIASETVATIANVTGCKNTGFIRRNVLKAAEPVFSAVTQLALNILASKSA